MTIFLDIHVYTILAITHIPTAATNSFFRVSYSVGHIIHDQLYIHESIRINFTQIISQPAAHAARNLRSITITHNL